MPSPSISVVNCAKRLSSASRRRQSYSSAQYRQTSLIHCSGAPWLQSSTSSASGQRRLRNLRLQIVEHIVADRNTKRIDCRVHDGRAPGRLASRQLTEKGALIFEVSRWIFRPKARTGHQSQPAPLHTGSLARMAMAIIAGEATRGRVERSVPLAADDTFAPPQIGIGIIGAAWNSRHGAASRFTRPGPVRLKNVAVR